MKAKEILMAVLSALTLCACQQKEERSAADYPEWEYTQIRRQLAKGWNTWDTRSIMTQVYVEEKSGIQLSLLDQQGNECDQIRIGNQAADAPKVHPYDHTYDGRYCEADVSWHDIEMKMRCTAQGRRLVMLLTPTSQGSRGQIKVRPGSIWERIQGNNRNRTMEDHFELSATMNTYVMQGYVVGRDVEFVSKGGKEGYYLCQADAPVLICTEGKMTVEEAEALLTKEKEAIRQEEKQKWGKNYEIHRAMQSVLGWDTVYDPSDDIVITPVNRNWNMTSSGTSQLTGGYVLFEWDTYFASEMLALDSRELAYCNAIEITLATDKCGFVPNYMCSHNNASYDRSQPPVGSRAIWKIYERWGDRWLLELLYPRLLRWNEWWTENRLAEGLLCWGSTPRNGLPYQDERYAYQQGRLETLDNSHVYDNAEFLLDKNIMCYNDPGLNALYVTDCQYLALIAKELGRRSEARQIKARGKRIARNMQQLWSEEKGIFLCRDLRNGQLVNEMDPTNFYPMLAQVATKEQARRMVEEHLLNEEEFWGEWVIPCSPRNSPSFQDNNYWRGRIWGPTNYLVYLGLENYDFPEVRKQFAEKSRKLLLKDWLVQGYVYENWNATTGQGDDVGSSDRFYHWGALLGYISMMHQK